MPQRRPRPRRTLAAALVAGVALALAAGSAVPALAAPVPALAAPVPADPGDAAIGAARTAQAAAAADVDRISAAVDAAEAQLEQLTAAAEVAGAALGAAQETLASARVRVTRTAADLRAATAAATAAGRRLADFSSDRYKAAPGGLGGAAALLDAAGPGDLLQRAATLDYVGQDRVDVLDAFRAAQAQQAAADTAARAARDESAAAEAAAAAAKDRADAAVAGQQATADRVSAQQDRLEQQLRDAQVRLLELQGARDAHRRWQEQQQAAAAAAGRAATQVAAAAAAARAAADRGVRDLWVLPAAGRVSSCFGTRWGTEHLGVDLAAPIGTPVYAASSGTVERAGPATGFGLAVYLRGDDGAVTVYGHVDTYSVHAGQRVTVGQQIAEVGNRGRSSGPHLHLEVHPGGGLYTGAVDPVPWLDARRVTVGGCDG